MKHSLLCLAVAACAAGTAAGQVVFPSGAHAFHNFIPFGPGTAATPVNDSVQHQVFRSGLFGTSPVEITRIAFAPGAAGLYNSNVAIRLGYTTRNPGVTPPAGLDIPVAGGGGAPNAAGALTTFYANPAFSKTFTIIGTEAWDEMPFTGSFIYDPAQGNLLLEIVNSASLANSIDLAVSRTAGDLDSSRSYLTTRFAGSSAPTTATRVQFTFEPASTCYPDCNGDGQLNLSDFGCFTTRFALGEAYADCNGDGIRNLSDFGCFTTKFALGCP